MMAGLLVALALFGLIFALAEYLYRRGTSVQITRKITHIGSGIVAAALPFLINLPVALGLGLFFSLSYCGPKRRAG